MKFIVSILVLISIERCHGQSELLQQFFEDIYIINLDRSPHRLASAGGQLKTLGLPFTRFSGIDGYILRDILETEGKVPTKERLGWPAEVMADLESIFIKNEQGNWQVTPIGGWGSLGCWQSHLQTYHQIMTSVKSGKNRDGPFLILEDDIAIKKSFVDDFDQLVQDLPNDWELLAFGYCCSSCMLNISNLVCKTDHFMCAQAYAIRDSKVAQKLWRIANTKLAQVSDIVWLKYMKNGYLKTYRTVQQYFVQDRVRMGSDIHRTATDPEIEIFAIRDDERVPIADL